MPLQAADVVLAMRSQMRNGSWARDAAKTAGVPVYAVKNSSASHLVRALETLLGLQPSAGSLFESDSSDEDSVQYQSHVVSMVSYFCCDVLPRESQQMIQFLPSTPVLVSLGSRVTDLFAIQAASILQFSLHHLSLLAPDA